MIQLKKNLSGHESQGALSQDELIGGESPVTLSLRPIDCKS
jgi:hypothetical protein